jgi:hypothetical protein
MKNTLLKILGWLLQPLAGRAYPDLNRVAGALGEAPIEGRR